MPPTTVLVISDGARDGGRTSPQDAADRARALHVPVSTVLVGTDTGVVTAKLVGGCGSSSAAEAGEAAGSPASGGVSRRIPRP